MRTLRLLTIAVLSTIAVASSAAAQTVVSVDRFRSVELRHGGHVLLRHGRTQRVTILTGNPRCTLIRVADGERLVIDNSGPDCPRHDRLRIEIVTPEILALSVSNGGTLQTLGAFPVQRAMETSVEGGGTIDIRSITADAVHASIHSGGRIFTSPRETLTAAIVSGGAITYWGNVQVRQSVRGGGGVQRGNPADADKPLSELSPGLPVIPPLPPIPPRHG